MYLFVIFSVSMAYMHVVCDMLEYVWYMWYVYTFYGTHYLQREHVHIVLPPDLAVQYL